MKTRPGRVGICLLFVRAGPWLSDALGLSGGKLVLNIRVIHSNGNQFSLLSRAFDSTSGNIGSYLSGERRDYFFLFCPIRLLFLLPQDNQ